MTLDDVYGRLSSIDSQVQELAWDAGIDENGVPWEYVAINEDDPDEVFLRDSAVRLMKPFLRLHEELEYLRLPCTGEHTLMRFPSGHYGYEDETGRCRFLFCGSRIEALVTDGHGFPAWVRSRIEHNGLDYYLYGHADVPLDGLVVRERGE